MSDKPTTKAKQRIFVRQLIRRVNARKITWAELETELMILYGQLHNREPVKKARPRAAPVTAATRQAVIDFYRDNPTMLNRHIALEFNIDAGRVSEILAGKRT